MNKKTERKILSFIYPNYSSSQVVESEQPDFILKENNLKFGVEVTEFRCSDIGFRLENIPNYIDDLLDHEKFRHKEDIEQLTVDYIQYINTEGDVVHRTKAVGRNGASIEEYRTRLCQRIKSKSESLKGYDTRLSHVNLIIHDKEGLFSSKEKNDLFELIFSSKVCSQILLSNYQEIYLITDIKSKKRVYIPLKMTLILSKIFSFDSIAANVLKLKGVSIDKYHDYMLEYLSFEGFRNLREVRHEMNIEIIYGGSGILIKNGKEITVLDYNDFSTNPSAKAVVPKKCFITPEIRNSIDEHNKEIFFKIGLAFAITEEE